MKNLVNYLDDYLEDDLYECSSKNIKDMKDRMKSFKKGSRENDTESYNKSFKNKFKYTRKTKHKNNEF